MSDSIWSNLGDLLIDKGLPLLGAAVAGPAGATLGGVIANTLGSESSDPKDLIQQISTASPDKMHSLMELQYRHKEKLEELAFQRYEAGLKADTARIESVNQTMRVEAASDSWSGVWRPIWGIVSAAAFLILAVAIAIMMFTNPALLPEILAGLASMEWFWGIPLAVLGVASWHRGQERRIRAGEHKPGITGLITAMKGKSNG